MKKTPIQRNKSLLAKILPTFFDKDTPKQYEQRNAQELSAYEKQLKSKFDKELEKAKLGIVYKNTDAQTVLPYKPEKNIKFFDNPREYFANKKVASNLRSRLLINMELENGEHTQFFVEATQESFIWNAKRYIIDHKVKYYNLAAKCYSSDYHENFSCPIERKIPIEAIRNAVKGDKVLKVTNATNPENLQRFVISDVIAKLIAGAQIEEFIQKIKMYLLILIIMTAGILLLCLKIAGIIKF